MIEAMSEWAVGFVILTIVMRFIKLRAEGFPAFVLLTIVPFGVGVFIFAIFGVNL